MYFYFILQFDNEVKTFSRVRIGHLYFFFIEDLALAVAAAYSCAIVSGRRDLGPEIRLCFSLASPQGKGHLPASVQMYETG